MARHQRRSRPRQAWVVAVVAAVALAGCGGDSDESRGTPSETIATATSTTTTAVPPDTTTPTSSPAPPPTPTTRPPTVTPPAPTTPPTSRPRGELPSDTLYGPEFLVANIEFAASSVAIGAAVEFTATISNAHDVWVAARVPNELVLDIEGNGTLRIHALSPSDPHLTWEDRRLLVIGPRDSWTFDGVLTVPVPPSWFGDLGPGPATVGLATAEHVIFVQERFGGERTAITIDPQA